MSWRGKFLGGSLGSFLGPWGALAGAAAGHYLVDRKAPDSARQRQKLLAVMAGALYQVARADGGYSAQEDRVARQILAECNERLGGPFSRYDLNYLLDDCGRIDNALGRLAQLAGGNPDLAYHTLVCLWRVAVSNGVAQRSQCELIEGYAHNLPLPPEGVRNAALLYVRQGLDETGRRNALDVLQLPYHASPEAVKQAYRSLSLTYHPDKHAALEPAIRALAGERFAQIKAAYDRLTGENRTTLYCRQGSGSGIVEAQAGLPVLCFACQLPQHLPDQPQWTAAHCRQCQALLAFEYDLAIRLSDL